MSYTTEKEKKRQSLVGAVRGVLTGLSAQGDPLVDFCGNPSQAPLSAVATLAVQREDVGKEAILLFEDGDAARPILVGLVQAPASVSKTPSRSIDVTVDGRRLTLSAENEISISCGEASITLTRAGKILIKGTYLLSRSTGPNRIKGGSVQLN